MSKPQLVKVPRREAQYARCETCQLTLGGQYWGPRKSAYLHEQGTGHKVDFYAWRGPNVW